MTGIDDRLERDLERAARPTAQDPGGTLEDVRRRRARRSVVRKTQTIGLVAVVLVGTAAGFLALQRNFVGADQPAGTGSTSTPSPSTTGTTIVTPMPLPSDPTHVYPVDGLAFPVCRGSSIAGNFLGTGQTFAYVFTKGSDGGCDTDTTIVAVQVPSDPTGTKSTLAVGGPLDCQDPSTCFVWANPDIDGDGQDEIAIVSKQGASTTSFELYEARHTSEGWGLVPFIDERGFPTNLSEGGSVMAKVGTYCDESTGERRFIFWFATSSDGTTYDVTQTQYAVGEKDGSPTLIGGAPTHQTAPADGLPPSGLAGCGGSIQNPTTP